MSDVLELTPTEFCRRWPKEKREEITLLDVREPAEIEIASIPDTTIIPMMSVPNRLQELNPDATVVVMCHSGGRSRRVAEFLLASGFKHVFNLSGGIDAWSQQIDPSVPRY